jgi:hypothetical protein
MSNIESQPRHAHAAGLLTAALEFNFLPIRYIHDSWLAALPHGAPLASLRCCRRVEQRLSRQLLVEFDLAGRYWFDFTVPASQIALLDGASLEKLVFYTGLALNARHISRIVARDELLPLKQSLGETAYLFAVKRAPFLTPLSAQGELPERYAEDMREHLTISGLKCLSQLLAGYGPALTQRLRLKLPLAWCEHFTPPLKPLAPTSAGPLVANLLKELNLHDYLRSPPGTPLGPASDEQSAQSD